MGFALVRRQSFVGNNNGIVTRDDGFRDDDSDNFWYSDKAEIIKWAVAGGITLFFLLWFVGGYIHARRRVRKGLKPLLYHRFLLPYSQRAQFEPQNNFSFYRQENQGYPMDQYGPPPPVYNADNPQPPQYMPPPGGTKANPSQEWIAPPPGPPLGALLVDEEAGVQPGVKPDAKSGRFAKLKLSIPKPSMPSKITPFSK